MRGIFKFLLPLPLTVLASAVTLGGLAAPGNLDSHGLASRLLSNAFQSTAEADAIRPAAQGQILMADDINSSSSSSSSVSSSSSSTTTTQQNTDGKPRVECSTSATATTDVNGQRKTDHSEKTVHDADNGCNATSSAHSTTSPDPQTKTESIIQQNTE